MGISSGGQNSPRTTITDSSSRVDSIRRGDAHLPKEAWTGGTTNKVITRTEARQPGTDVLERIRAHVQDILGRGSYTQDDYVIQETNLAEARQWAREPEALALYANVAILKESGPLQAGFDLSALQEHWPIIAAVGGGLLLIKLLKKRGAAQKS